MFVHYKTKKHCVNLMHDVFINRSVYLADLGLTVDVDRLEREFCRDNGTMTGVVEVNESSKLIGVIL